MSVSIKRGVFAATCFGALAVSAIYPAWGAIQKLESYGGYADIMLQTLGLPSNAIAGVSTSLPLRVTNLGPEAADFPQVIFSADPQFVLTATKGCLDSPSPSARCHLAPLAVGESRDIDFTASIAPWVRGNLTLGAFAMSEAIDVQPGNEMVIAVPRIDAYVDLQSRLLNQQPLVDASGRLIWEMEVSNSGVSDALYPALTLGLFPFDQVDVACVPVGLNAQCPGPLNLPIIGIGSSLRYTLTFPPLSETNPQVSAYLSAYPQSPNEYELNSNDNTAFVELGSVLFGDDFEF